MSKIDLYDVNPADYSYLFSLDGGGRELIENEIKKIIQKKGSTNILEIGSYLGHSSKRWLKIDKKVNLIVSDLFIDNGDLHRDYIKRNVSWATKQYKNIDLDKFLQNLDMQDGQLRCFRKNLDEFINRIFVYKGPIFQNIDEIQKKFVIDLIFIDADKTEETLKLASRYFPEAVLSGDDWEWGKDKDFPIRRAVEKFCKDHNYFVISKNATWIIKRELNYKDKVLNIFYKIKRLLNLVWLTTFIKNLLKWLLFD